MLRYVPKKTFQSDVQVELPSGDRGTFTAEFNYYDRDALDKLVEENLPDRDLLDRILVKVSKIVGEDGKELDSDIQREIVMNDLAMSNKATQRFLEVLGGAAKGNSRRSRVL